MSTDEFNEVVSALYDAALADDPWDRVIDLAAGFVGLDVGMARLADYRTLDTQILGYTGHSGEMYESAPEDETLLADPWAKAIGYCAPDDVFVGSRQVDPDIYLKLPLFTELMPSFDIGVVDGMGSLIPIGDKALGFFMLYRRLGSDFVQADEIERYRHLHGHVRRALDVAYRLSDLKAVLAVKQHLIDTLPYGVFGIAGNGNIVMKNKPGDRMLAGARAVCQVGGQLHATGHEDDGRLQRAILTALGPGLSTLERTQRSATALKIYPKGGGRPWTALVCPAPQNHRDNPTRSAMTQVRAIVCISDHAPIVDLRVNQIAAAYGLTQAETLLLHALANGMSLPQIAKQTGRSVNTLKTQLRLVFEKTEQRSQNDLVRLVLSAPVGL